MSSRYGRDIVEMWKKGKQGLESSCVAIVRLVSRGARVEGQGLGLGLSGGATLDGKVRRKRKRGIGRI